MQAAGTGKTWPGTARPGDSDTGGHISTEPRINERIRVPEVRLVGPGGEQIGIVAINDALQLAQEADLDLVEVAPTARPPVCKLMDFGKFKYESALKARESRKNQTQTVIKEIKLRPKIDPHDYGTKKGHVERFLKQGDKVKVTIMFRGREQSRPELGYKLLQRLAGDIGELGIIESQPKQDGRNMIMVIGPTKKKADVKAERATPARASARATAAHPAADQSAAPQSAAPRQAADQPAAFQLAADQPAAPRPAADRSAAPQSAAPRPAADRSAAPQSAAPRPAADRPAAPRPAAPRPAADRPAADRPAAPRPAAPRPAAPRPAADRPAADQSAAPRPAGPHSVAPRPAAPRPTAPRPAAPRPAAPRPAPRPAAPRPPGGTAAETAAKPVPVPRPKAAQEAAGSPGQAAADGRTGG
jgi:translation initiation factor IF-3